MTIRRMIIVSTFAALLVIATYITIPMQPVSFTLQTMMVVLIGLLLKPVDAFLTILVYVLVGLTGVPVFSNFRGGYEVLFGATGGFIMSFFITAVGISILKSDNHYWVVDIPIMVFFGFIVTYLMGIPIFMNVTGNDLGSSMTFFAPYYLWDFLKLGLAFTIYLMLPHEIMERIYRQ